MFCHFIQQLYYVFPEFFIDHVQFVWYVRYVFDMCEKDISIRPLTKTLNKKRAKKSGKHKPGKR